MKITVAVCTWNRAKLLDKTLAEMQKLAIPHGVEWELIVVNNNCTDDTDQVLARNREVLPLRRVLEERQGQCHARNAAIDHARGDYVIWTDDDVLVDAHWLEEYCRAFLKWPEAAYFGGKIRPWFESNPPAWIVTNLRILQGMLVVREFDEDAGVLNDKLPFGANMAFRRDVFSFERFDPRIGLCGDDHVRGDETAFFHKLRQRGLTGIWVPTAEVRHFVGRERATVRFLWKYHVGMGRTEVRLSANPSDGAALGGAPRWLYRTLWVSGSRALMSRALAKKSWVRDYAEFATQYGKWLEFRDQRRSEILKVSIG